MHPVVYGCGEHVFVWIWVDSAVAKTFALEVPAVRNLFDHRCRRDHPRAGPGHYGTTPDLSLSGTLPAMDVTELLGIGTGVRGRFGGRSILSGEYADEDLVNMLLEIPSGLRFTEVRIRCAPDDLLSAVRTAEACSKTLVKLSHMVNVDRESHPFSQSGWFHCTKC